MPTIVRPQLAILSARPPEGDKWLHEIKYDGYRTVTRIDRLLPAISWAVYDVGGDPGDANAVKLAGNF
jgi:hypothetical protein